MFSDYDAVRSAWASFIAGADRRDVLTPESGGKKQFSISKDIFNAMGMKRRLISRRNMSRSRWISM
ncbi:MAG: hypothetical protein VB078_05505 [Clostridiaceae bacterium]|nr:hypothetical protein [Clostridiaceae bacterium]